MSGHVRLLAVSGAVLAALCGAGTFSGLQTRPHLPPPAAALPVRVAAAAPLDNDASAGRVVLTFDDGPDSYTAALLAELKALHLHAVFFVFGWKAEDDPALIRDELAAGDLVENHTWDHLSFTGASTGTAAMPAWKIRAELASTQQALTGLGVPAPYLYRPPFGDISAADNEIAASMGLRIVEPFSVIPGGNITDSRDWTGITAAQIVRAVTRGYWLKGRFYAGIHAGSIIGFHDSAPGRCTADPALCADVLQTIKALPGIVAWLNARHLGVTTVIGPDATGGAVPPAAAGPHLTGITRRQALAALITASLAPLTEGDTMPHHPVHPPFPGPPPAPLPANGGYAFADDFSGPQGSPPDPSKWAYDTGPGSAVGGNNETQTYTDHPVNASVNGAGQLVLAVTNNRAFNGFDSARIKTLGKFSQVHGSWQARIAIRDVPGCWPAFWLMGAAGKWPACGEADVMEAYGSGFTEGTFWNSAATASASGRALSAPGWAFHTYQADFGPGWGRFYVDGVLYVSASQETLRPWPFDNPAGLYAILNIATNGTGTGGITPDPLSLPVAMLVDYVRAWK